MDMIGQAEPLIITEAAVNIAPALEEKDRSHSHLTFLRSEPGDDRLIGVGHRIVHGGPDYAGPGRVDPGVVAKLESLIPLAPAAPAAQRRADGDK